MYKRQQQDSDLQLFFFFTPVDGEEMCIRDRACKAAIKGGWTSDPAELKILVEKVQSGEVRYCPHGRPVVVKVTKYELEKLFKRA